MATDIKQIIKNLLAFYDFTGKTVISVGAGGGQMIAYAEPAKRVIAIDCDPAAIKRLEENLKNSPLGHKFEVITADLNDVDASGDVVLFEICLHEMSDPVQALKKAQGMAKDLVIFEHLPGRWAHYTGEYEKIEKSWKAIRTFKIREEKKFDAIQAFKDYTEIYEKIKSQGEPALTRIKDFQDSKDFTIPMPYAMALI